MYSSSPLFSFNIWFSTLINMKCKKLISICNHRPFMLYWIDAYNVLLLINIFFYFLCFCIPFFFFGWGGGCVKIFMSFIVIYVGRIFAKMCKNIRCYECAKMCKNFLCLFCLARILFLRPKTYSIDIRCYEFVAL